MKNALLASALLLAVFWAPQGHSQPSKKSKNAHYPLGSYFQTSDRCLACHNGLTTSGGEDISIGFSWRPTMMANAARDPYWQAGVRRETIDHPAAAKTIEDECSKCHMPAARYEAHIQGQEGEVFAHLPFDMGKTGDRLAADGVTCSVCHQIEKDNFGTKESFVGGFKVDTEVAPGKRAIYGPYEIDPGHTRIMNSSSNFKPTEGKHVRQSELCATCHTLITQALGPGGQAIGELPEQMPYQEWLASEYKDTKSCQNCHMPVVEEEVPITRVLGKNRPEVSRHLFVGGNFFIERMLNKYRGELGVTALSQELEAAAARTTEHLRSQTAHVTIDRLEVAAGRLTADIAVENLSGHKFPTAYPSRRAWLHVTVKDSGGRTLFESGRVNPNGSIEGNDNDSDASRFEPHYSQITSADQVQIYEAIMVDSAGKPTTGLLSAVKYEKDNRLLPKGFRPRDADPRILPQGAAAQDADFTAGGDKIRYSVAIGNAQGPFQVEAELWFQPISFRWASNLKTYDAMEPRRFSGYYDVMAPASALMLARVSAAH